MGLYLGGIDVERQLAAIIGHKRGARYHVLELDFS